jgi:hypothetical protein
MFVGPRIVDATTFETRQACYVRRIKAIRSFGGCLVLAVTWLGTDGHAGDVGEPTREATKTSEGIAIPLKDDTLWQRFDRRVQTGRETRFRARLMGCCSLIVIQQVLALD